MSRHPCRSMLGNNHSWGKTLLLQLALLVLIQQCSNIGTLVYVYGQDTDVAPEEPPLPDSSTSSSPLNETSTPDESTATATKQQQQDDNDEIHHPLSLEELEHTDLHTLSDKELEEVCIMRGFELYREMDEETGEEYQFTHEDYVEAAKQCLAVEREMNEILAEHPELLEELHSEVNHMVEEKKRLDEKLAAAKAEQEEGGTSGSITDEGETIAEQGTSVDGNNADEVDNDETTTTAKSDETDTATIPSEQTEGVEDINVDEDDATTETAATAEVKNDDDTTTTNTQMAQQQQQQAQSQLQQKLQSLSKTITARLHQEFGQKIKILTRLVEEKVPKQIKDPVRKVVVKISPVIHKTFLGVFEFLKTHLEALMNTKATTTNYDDATQQQEPNTAAAAAATA